MNKHFKLFIRETLTFWLLELAMYIAPKELELVLAKGIITYLPDYNEKLFEELKNERR